MQGKKNHQEKLFITFRLSDHVPADNLYRRLGELIDFSFLYKSTAKYYGKEGQKSIDPVVFMKLILVGYLENLNSDRRIINALRLRLDIRYFIGYELDEKLPWHSTLSRTRKLYGEHVFIELFKNILKQCIDKGMISGRRQAVDSVFIKANASMDSMLLKEILADADCFSQELTANEGEEAIVKELDPDNRNKDDQKNVEADVEDALVKELELNKKPTADKGRYSALANKPHPIAKTHYSPVDPDSRISTKRGKQPALNYLGQIAVDTATHMITYVQAFLADKRDSQCLPGVLANMVSNLQENDIIVKEVVADSGYSSGTTLKTIEAMGIEGYIPNLAGYKFEREGFIYHPEGDYYECRNGETLSYQGTYDGDKRYTGSQKNCIGCPFKDTCIGNKREIALTETIYKPYYDRMHIKMQTKKAKQLGKKRQSTVEPVIGTLVDYLGIKKVRSRGIEQANKCLNMAAIAYNIKKLLNYKPRGVQDNINRLRKGANKGLYQAITALVDSLTDYWLAGVKIKSYYRILT